MSPLFRNSAPALRIAAMMLASLTTDGEVHDIVCSGDRKTYAQPGECIPSCPVRLGRSFGCALDPHCAPFQSDKDLRVFYNQAAFGRGPVKRPDSQRVLTAHIVNRYFAPFNAGQFDISIGAADAPHWARITSQPGPTGKIPLEIPADTFRTTPAYLAMTIGHELIHFEQLSRKSSKSLSVFGGAASALWELEASSWELRKDAFAHSIPQNKFLECITPEEKAEAELRYKCAAWKASSEVHHVLTNPRAHVYEKQFRLWLNTDPWVKNVWLDVRRDLTADPGKIPEGCDK